MIKIDDTKTLEFIISFIKAIKEKQDKIKDKIVYSPVKLCDIIKYEIFIPNFFVHPKVLKTKEFYEDCEENYSTEQMLNKIKEVLEYELCESFDKLFLTDKESKELITYCRRLESDLQTSVA